MEFQIRQGDVLIERILAPAPAAPLVSGEAPVDEAPLIVAYGEGTGHAHRVIAVDPQAGEGPAAQLVDGPEGRLLRIAYACELTHDEHASILLAPGTYRVTLQREYEPGGVRNVAD
jgi:hypothetical protein